MRAPWGESRKSPSDASSSESAQTDSCSAEKPFAARRFAIAVIASLTDASFFADEIASHSAVNASVPSSKKSSTVSLMIRSFITLISTSSATEKFGGSPREAK